MIEAAEFLAEVPEGYKFVGKASENHSDQILAMEKHRESTDRQACSSGSIGKQLWSI